MIPFEVGEAGAVITGLREGAMSILFFPLGFDFDTFQINDENFGFSF